MYYSSTTEVTCQITRAASPRLLYSGPTRHFINSQNPPSVTCKCWNETYFRLRWNMRITLPHPAENSQAGCVVTPDESILHPYSIQDSQVKEASYLSPFFQSIPLSVTRARPSQESQNSIRTILHFSDKVRTHAELHTLTPPRHTRLTCDLKKAFVVTSWTWKPIDSTTNTYQDLL